jgi:predicted PurR-regulated permease PerM
MTPPTSTSARRDSSVTFFKSLVVVAGLLLSGFLIWALRRLILPAAVGGLLAYICYPLVAGLERFRLTRGLAIGLLLLAFVFAGFFLVNRVSAGIPNDAGVLELRVRALHNVNRRYGALMRLDPSLTRGNWIYQLAHEDLDPLVNRLNRILALSPEEQTRFLSSRPHSANAPTGPDRLQEYLRENLRTLETRAQAVVPRAGTGDSSAVMIAPVPKRVPKTPLAALAGLLSTWVVAPAVFLFLLRDTGQIKCGFLRIVPNRLFEPALAILTDLDRALGGYVRGVFLESAALGISVALLLTILGVPINWAILIGLVSGATNPVPYVGSAVALVAGLSYSLFSDEVHPLLPMIRAENVVLWLILGVAMIELLKNLLLEPLLLGSTTKLHPLVVLFAVLGGGILFGVVGLLLALPTVTISTALVSSASHQLKAYGLI